MLAADADLIVSDATAAQTAVMGEAIPVSWTVSNQGSGITDRTWNDSVFLSSDPTLDTTVDRLLVNRQARFEGALDTDDQYTAQRNVLIPNTTEGANYLLFVTDTADAQQEIDPTNNLLAVPIDITAPDVDLVITAGTNTTSLVAGQEVSFHWTVQNIGGDVATNTSWQDRLYLSDDATYDNDDRYIGGRSANAFLPLGPGASYSSSLDVSTLNSDFVGDQFLLMVTDFDDRQAESDQANNVVATPINIAASNLAVTDVDAPTVAIAGESIEISMEVTNEGTQPALARWRDSVYFSFDETLGSDQFLVAVTVNDDRSLEPGQSYTNTFRFNLPLNIAGDGYLLLATDSESAQLETDEADNVFAWPISIPTPDLTVTDAVAPTSAVAGDSVDVSWTVANSGAGPANANWQDGIYLSADPILDDDDSRLWTENAYDKSPLPAGADYEQFHRLNLYDATPGEQYLLFQADDRKQQPESDESNNVLAVPITLTAPNLVPTELEIPASAPLGSEITAEWIVLNDSEHPANGQWYDALYLSADEIFDPSDLSLSGNSGLSPLEPGESYTQDRSFQLRGEAGEQFILLVINENEQQGETDQSDNVIAQPITVTTDATNLVPTDFAAPAVAVSGETIGVTWTVTNDGAEPVTAPWYDTIYLSSDDQFDPADQSLTQIYQGNRAPLPGGSSYTETIEINLRDAAKGVQYLLVRTDSFEAQSETNEVDNVRAIPIDISLPNLVVSEVVAPTTAASGEVITVSWTTTNDSPHVAADSWNDSIYLSHDPLFDSSDRSLRSVSTSSLTPLAAGEGYSTSSSDVQLSSVGAGDYFLIVVANSNTGQAESDDYDNAFATPLTVGLPDVLAKDFNAPTSAVLGETLNLTWTVENIGDVIATGSNFSWRDEIYLSDDAVLSRTFDTRVGTKTIRSETPLDPTESYTASLPVLLRSIDAGNKFLILSVDASNSQYESDKTNNQIVIPIELTAPDLVVSDSTTPATVVVGERIDVSWTVTNQGDHPAAASWRDYVYLSDDEVFDSSDRQLLNQSSSPLAAGQSYTRSGGVTPSNLEPGDQFLLFVTDRTDQQGETDTTNNVRAVPITLTAPDLVVTTATAPAIVNLGEAIDVTWTIQNDGLVPAVSAWSDGFYLSRDDKLDSSDTGLRTVSASAEAPLDPGSNYTKTQSVEVSERNVRSGDRYLLVVADSQSRQSETDEDNNVFAIPIELKSPDLVVTSVVGPAIVKPGQEAEISWTVQNVGDGIATQNWRDFVAITPDKDLSCPFECGEFDIDLTPADAFVPLGPGESYTQTGTFTIPQRADFGDLLTPGNYFLGVKADENYGDDQSESNEDNNERFVPISVIAPDVDLVVSDLIVPESAQLGEVIQVTATITNLGTETATGSFGSWSDQIRLSDDDTYSFNDTFLFNRNNRNEIPLEGGQSYTFTQDVTITSNAAGGDRFIVLQTDTNNQVETDETNNFAAAPIEILAPNLTITNVTAPQVASLSQSVNVAWTVKNDSDVTALADWRDRVYLSDDDVFGSGDRFLTEQNVSGISPLAPGATYTANRGFTFSNVTAGSKFLLFVTDSNNNQGETDEVDNIVAVPIELASADLVLTEISGPSEVSVGESVALSRTVQNQGIGLAPANWSDAVYLSIDTSLDSSDPRVGFASASAYRPLGVGSGYTAPIEVTIPNVPPGDYFFIVKTDAFSAQAEISETNNSDHLPVTVIAPDLELTDAAAPASAVSNQSIAVSYTVTNVSNAVAGANWQDRIYLSTDGTLGGVVQSPLRIEPISSQTPLVASDSYTIQRDVVLPGIDPGDYFLVFQANSDSGQGETDSSNNLRSVPITIDAPNLTVADATVPSSGLVNEVINVSYRVLNDSPLTAFGDWIDRIWLSDDQTLDPTDYLFRSVQIDDQTPLLSGNDYTISTTVTLPRDSSGEKFLLFQANSLDQQGETSSTDNVLAAPISIAPPPNLVVTEIQAVTSAAVHEPVLVSYTVTNTGTTPAVGDWTDRVRLYLEADLSSDSSLLNSVGVGEQTPLAPGESYTIETTVTMPGAIGDRFLMVRTNDTEFQGETDYGDNHLFRPITLLAPDLEVDNVVAPDEGTIGESISISYTVTNPTDVPALSAWRDQVYLSSDPIFDAGDTAIPAGQIDAPTTLAGGESYVASRSVQLPQFATGTQYLIVVTDKDDAQLETDETNNVATAVAIQLRAADLTVTDVIVPSEAISGQAFNVTWTVTNDGDGPISNWTDRLLISTDQGIGGDLVLGNFPFSGTLLPGESVTRTQGGTPPIQQTGQHYVVITTDPTNAKPERDETNNSAISSETVNILQAPIPNLQPSALTTSAIERELFEAFEVEWVVSNVGTGATDTPYWRDEIYLSVDQTFDSTDVRIGSQLNPNYLNAGESYASSAAVFAQGVSEGDYYLLVRTDARNNVQEYFNESDNVVVGPQIRISFPPPPDLVVTNVIAPELAFSGQSMLLSWNVNNQGDARAISRWDDAVYMSEDSVLDASDQLLRTVAHQSLYQIHRTVSYSGGYESCFGQPTPEPVTNLVLESPNFDSVINSFLNLQSFDNRQSVCTIGNGLGGLIETVFRETSYEFDSIETHLDVGETYSRNVSVQLPIGISGDYYFFVLTDFNDRVNEFAFDNNNDNYDIEPTTINLTPPPDLEVTEVITPDSATAGRPFNISYSAVNAGSTRTPNTSWRDSFYLSTDATFDRETDTFLGDRGISFPVINVLGNPGGLDVDGTYSREVSLTMPDGLSGEYYLIAVADGTDVVFEVDNDNDLISSTPIVVDLESPDLIVSSVAVDDSVRAGESLTVNWTVTNQGIGDTIAGSWTDSIYASLDDQIGQDILLGSFTHFGRLNPAESYDRYGTVRVPLDLGGPVRLYVRTDVGNAVAEFAGESNNRSPFQPIDVLRETADLQVTATDFAAEDGRLRLGWQVENVGTNRANSSFWRDAVYLSSNDVFGDDDDVRLTSVYVSRTDSLPIGASYSINRLFDVPFDLNDAYHFFVVADEQNRVDESQQEANNVAPLGQIDTSSLRTYPDLIVQGVEAPVEAVSGQYFDVTWTVRNVGDPIAPDQFPPEHRDSNWSDAVYLSRDQVFDANSDFYLGRSVVSKSELVDVVDGSGTVQEYTRTRTFRVPDGVTGPLYVIVLTDRSNDVIEIDAEDNNRALDAESMFVSLAEVADLAIGVVNVPDDAALGASIALTYSLENLGANQVIGRWFDRLYLSTDDQFSLDDVSLGLALQDFNVINPGASKSFDFARRLPAVLPGDYHVILRTDAFNSIPESDELNNLGASLETFNINVATIELIEGTGSTEIEETIASRATRTFYYRFAAEAGQTIAIDGIGIDLAEETYTNRFGNQVTDVRRDTQSAVYLGFERVPTPIDYDLAETAWLSAKRNEYAGQRLVIPRTESGFYYLRVDVTDRQFGSITFDELSREHLRVELNELPFSIIAVEPAVVGNAGAATLDVTASNLNVCSAAELLHDGEVVLTSDQIRLTDQTNGFVTFDFEGLQPGNYQLRLTDHDGSNDTFDVAVEDGVGARVDGSVRGPRSVRAGREYVLYANYGNNGDSDGIAPLLMITNLDASPMALTREGLPTAPVAGSVVQALGISPDGDAGTLRPGQLNSVPVFFRVLGESRVGRFEMHTITADDSRPLDFSQIEDDLRPEELTADQWDQLKPAVQERIGPTWGSYVRALSRAATRLADVGSRTSDIRSLLASIVHSAANPLAPAFSGHAVESQSCQIVSDPVVRAISADRSEVAYSDATGRFEFSELPSGPYDLVVDAAGRARTIVSAVEVGMDPTELIIEMPEQAVIAGALALGTGGVVESATYVNAQRVDLPNNPAGQHVFLSTDSEFALGGLPGGTYDVVIGRTGYTDHTLRVTVAQGETVDLGSIELEAIPTIRGTVVSQLAQFPASDAVVGMFRDGEQIASSYVDSDGTFEFSVLAVGDFDLQVINNPVGYVTIESITAEPGETTDSVELQVVSGATISGTVRDSISTTPLAGIMVIARNTEGGVLSAVSDADGNYQFTQLPIDQYVVSLANGSVASSQSVDVDEVGQSPYIVDLATTSSVQVTGVVTDNAGDPVSGAAVSLSIDGQSFLTNRTDDQGRYRFLLASEQSELGISVSFDGASFAPIAGFAATEGTTTQDFQAGDQQLAVTFTGTAGVGEDAFVILKQLIGDHQWLVGTQVVADNDPLVFSQLVPGDYQVTVQRGSSAGGVGEVTIDGVTPAEIDVEVSELHTLTGRLTDPEGAAVALATIGLTAADGIGIRRVAVTDADGNFELQGIPAGSYDAVIGAEGFTIEVSEDLAIPAAGSLNLTLDSSTTQVNGRVVDANGSPLVYATVLVTDAEGRILVSTEVDPDGSYAISGLVGDQFTVSASQPGALDASITDVSIAADTNVDVGDLVLDAIGIGQGYGVNQQVSAAGEIEPAFLNSFINGFVGALIPFVADLLGDGDPEKLPDHFPTSDVPFLPSGCTVCGEQEVQAVIAATNQNLKFNAYESAYNEFEQQSLVTNALFVADILTLAGALAGLVIAIDGLIAYSAYAVVGQALTTVGTTAVGTSATGTLAVGTTVTVGPAAAGLLGQAGASVAFAETVAGVTSTILGIDGIIEGIFNGNSTSSAAAGAQAAKSTLDNAKSAITQLQSWFPTLFSTTNQTGNSGAVGSGFGLANSLAGAFSSIKTAIDGIISPMQNFNNALDYLSELETNYLQDQGTYEVTVAVANQKLNIYLGCLAVNDCDDDDDDDGNGNNNNGGGNNDDDNNTGPTPPTPPTPPSPPNVLNPFLIQSFDPNDIIGPDGFGEEGWIGVGQTLPYMIRFENVPDATGPAQRVTIEQQLDEDLDPRTFRVDDFGWGDFRMELDGDQPFFQGRVELQDGSGLVVDVTAIVDVVSGLLTWVFQTIDPAIGIAPEDALAGFLPPNVTKGEGEGFVTYTIRPRRNATTGTRIDADATIVFDTNEPIDTPDIFNTLDARSSVSQIGPLPETSELPPFLVSWSGQDDEDGSALADFSIFVSIDDGPWQPWLVDTTLTEAIYEGEPGREYGFVATSRDNAGNIESLVPQPDAVTKVAGGEQASIGNFVWNDGNNNGLQDADEPGMPGVTIRLLDADGETLLSTSTNEEGLYSFESLDPDTTYAIEVVSPDGFTIAAPNQGLDDTVDSDVDPVTLRSEEFLAIPGENDQWDVGLVPLGTILGLVWDDQNGNSIREPSEPPLVGWTVYLDANRNGQLDELESSQVTDNEGTYQFNDLVPGAYVVAQQVQAGWVQTYPGVLGASSASTTGSVSAVTDFDSNSVAADLIELDQLRADDQFAGFTGSGYSVVVIDSGIDQDHPSFGPDTDGNGVADRIVYQYDFADDDSDASDRTGHGSHLASLIGSESRSQIGIAPDVNLIALKVFGDDGRGFFVDVERALQWVVENAARYNVAAINLSFGDGANWTESTSQFGLGDELAWLADHGVITVTATGNQFGSLVDSHGVQYPAADPNTIAVGALGQSQPGDHSSHDSSDRASGAVQIASFSQRDHELTDIFAPGVLISAANAFGGQSEHVGTSQSASFVAGAAVLAQQMAWHYHGQQLTSDQFRSLLDLSSVSIADGDQEAGQDLNGGAKFQRLDLHALATQIAERELPVTSGSSELAIEGGAAIETLGGQAFAYSIDLAPGQVRDEVDFGNQSLPVGSPTVSGLVQDGLSQRSYIDSLQFDFSEQVNLAELIADGSIVGAVRIHDLGINVDSDPDPSVPLTAAQFRYEFDEQAGVSRLLWSLDEFTGSSSSLHDGMYEVLLDAEQITDVEGNPLDGDGDERGGDDYRMVFHRLQGDADGSRLVDQADMDLVNAALGSQPTIPNWNDNADLDRDDRVSVRDRVIVAGANGNGIIDGPAAGSVLDANADGKVSALDALVIINNLSDPQVAAQAPIEDSAPASRLDVNRDGRVSALDALLVINQLAGQSTVLLNSTDDGSEAGPPVEPEIVKPEIVAADLLAANFENPTDVDDDEDWLRLLADDQARIGIGETP